MSNKVGGTADGQCPIAIIGMGCVFPGAANLTEYWRMLRRGEDGIRDVPPTHWAAGDYFDADPKKPDHTYCTRGGFLDPVNFDPTAFGIPPNILEATDTSQLLSLVVAQAALEDAGYGDDREFNRERTGVILGITGTQELVIPLAARLGHPLWRKALAEAGVEPDVAEDVVARIADGYVGWQENSFPGLLGNVVAGRIANRLNLRGTNCVIDAACASSLGAVHLAMLELATGRSDMVLTGGADTLNDIFMFMCFSKTPALSPTGDARPFSDDADGTVLGEGIGMLVLKRLKDAERDGDRIYAVLRGIGTSSDGRSQSIYAPHPAGQARCLRNAYAIANVEPESITLLEAHGTGTKVGDAAEFEALRTVFREARAEGSWCSIGSVKSQIGHTKAAAGAAGMIKAALSVYFGALPPTIKVRRPNPAMELETSPFKVNTELRPWLTGGETPRRAGVSSFGFGGSNFHAVLEAHHAALPQVAWDGTVQIIAFSAESNEGLIDAVKKWRSILGDDLPDWNQLAYDASQSRRQFNSRHQHRLVIVVSRTDDPRAIIADALKRISDPTLAKKTATDNVFTGMGARPGKLAFLFPGQGSQYVAMCRVLASTFPEMRVALDRVHSVATEQDVRLADFIYPVGAFEDATRSAQSAQLTRTEVAQPALGAIAVGLTHVIERFGVVPDISAGHSYGELVALWAAGVIDEPTLHRLTKLRGRLMAGGGDDRGTMLAVKAPLADIEQLLVEERLDLVLANRNAPNQGVLSGRRDEIARAAAACKARGMASQQLSVAGAFHSSLMNDAAAPLRNAIEAAEFHPGRLPAYSNATGSLYPNDPAAAKSTLATQLTSPVDFVAQVKNMHAAGVRTFVEVGPRSVLCGLVGAILGNEPHLALAIDASAGRKDAMVDLARALARLAADGFEVELDKWERPVREPRKPKMSVPLVGANYRATAASLARAVTTPVVTSTKPEFRREPTAKPSIERESKVVPKSSPPIQMPPLETGAPMTSFHPGTSAPPIPAPAHPNEIMMPSKNHSSSAPASSPTALTEALRLIQDGIRSMQALQQQTAAAHQKFLEGQEQAHRYYQQMLESQQRLLAQGMGPSLAAPMPALSTPPNIASPAPQPAPVMAPSALQTPPAKIVPPVAPTSAKKIIETSVAPVAPSTAPDSSGRSQSEIDSAILEIVSEKTGYPREMIELDMDIEADLGIDSIKRVEIIAAVEERMPGLASIKPDQMGSLRTLRQIVAFMAPSPGSTTVGTTAAGPSTLTSPTPIAATAPSSDSARFGETLLSVVAQLTGYPREMLELDMDMEADLGIDSIKRVEILAGVEGQIPNLPSVKPEFMGSMRTLRQIVEYYAGHSAAVTKSVSTNPTASVATEKGSAKPEKVERRTLQLVELPALSDDSARAVVDGPLMITDDGTPLATELQALLHANGIAAELVALNQIPTTQLSDNTAGLIILAPASLNTDGPAAAARFLRQSFAAAKTMAGILQSSGTRGRAMFLVITRMDGQLGTSGGPYEPAQGGIAGLVKTAAVEWPSVICRAVDLDSSWDNPQSAAAAVAKELSQQGPLEIGITASGRFGIELVSTPADRGAPSLSRGDVVVVTGGARGITIEPLVALAAVCQPTFVLLGRSPLPEAEPVWLAPLKDEAAIKQAIVEHEFAHAKTTPAKLQSAYAARMAAREIRRNIERLTNAGSKVAYEAVDVRDAQTVKSLMASVVVRHGPVRALVHAAGVLEDRLIADKTLEQWDRVFATKVAGFENILAAVGLETLQHLVMFSSVAARFGNTGQSDYASANEVLNKLARSLARRAPHCHVCAINWGPWDGGMVTAGLRREFARRGVSLIPLSAGGEAFVDELFAKQPAVEVVLGTGIPPALEDSPAAESAAAPRRAPASMSVAFEHALDLERHPFLESHVLAGRPVLPAAITAEWMAHAALHANPGLVFHGLDDLRILRGVVVNGDAPVLNFHSARPRRSGSLFDVDVEMHDSRTSGPQSLHATCTAVIADRLPAAPNAPDFATLIQRPYPRSIAGCYAESLFHGRHFHAIREIMGISEHGIVAATSAAPTPANWMSEPLRSAWITDPLALDAAFQLMILWSWEILGEPSLPSAIGRYRQYRSAFPAEGVTAVVQIKDHQPRQARADITFLDRSDVVVATIQDYICTVDASLRSAFQRREMAPASLA